jgi:colanic acid biosynthesis glycosyl transferase WcaI
MAGRVWIMSELYYPDEAATGYLLTRLAEGLAQRWPVHVLCGQPRYTTRGGQPRQETHHGVVIRRCAGTTLPPGNLIFRLINLCTLSAAMLLAAWRHIQPGDRVLVVTNPPVLPFIAALVCRRRAARGVLLIHDLYPDALVATGLMRSQAWLVRAWQHLNRWLFRQFARTIILGRDMQARAAPYLDGAADRLVTIPNWAEVETVRPMPRANNPLLSQLALEAKFVIQHSGTMGRIHGLADLLEAAERLRAVEAIQFLFIGAGSQHQRLVERVRKQQFPNIRFMPAVPRALLSQSLNACDVAVISFIPGMVGVSVPSRLYNIMAAGKPVIAVAEAGSELAQVVREEAMGWVVPPGRPALLAETILAARANPDELAGMGRRARAAAEVKYTFQRTLAAYAAALDEISPA